MKLKIFSDGGARGNPGPAASAFLVFENGEVIKEEKKYLGKATNNIAEYQALLMAINWLKKYLEEGNNTSEVVFHLDSELVVKQLNGEYKIKNLNLKQIADKIFSCEKHIKTKISYVHVKRELNKDADALVNQCLDSMSGM